MAASGTLRHTTLALLSLSWGCSIYQTASTDVSKALDAWERRQAPLRQEDVPARGSGPTRPDPPAPASAPESKRVHTRPTSPLHGSIMEALQRNPSVLAAAANARAKLEQIPQVTSLADPTLRAIVRPEPIQTAAGDMYFTLGVGQKIPLPAKLDRAGRIAAAELRMAIEQLNAARLRIISDVERAYYQLYLTDRSTELTAANRKLLEALARVVESQYRVGKVRQQDVLRVHTELSNLLNDEMRFRRQRESAAAALNQLLDYPPAREVPATEPIRPPLIAGRVEELVALAKRHNPDLAVLVHQAERDRERIELADLGYWPDLDVGFEWTYARGRDAWIPPRNPQTGMRPPINRKSEAGDDNWGLMFQVNVPIWPERIEAARRQARHNLDKTQHDKRAAFNLVAFRIHDAWARVQTHQDTIKLLESSLIPQARQTYELSLTAYQTEGADFLTVIDNWRQMLAFELMLHREAAGLETAFSELQREVGVQLIRSELASETGRNEVHQ